MKPCPCQNVFWPHSMVVVGSSCQKAKEISFFLELSILLKLGLIFFAETKWKGVFQQLSAFAEKVGANWSEKGRDVYSLVRSIFSPTIFFLNLFFHENKLGLSWAKLSSIWDWT